MDVVISNSPNIDVSVNGQPSINVVMETKVIGDRVQVDSQLSETSENAIQNKAVTEALGDKQDVLIRGQNIKTINGQSLLGKGNIVIGGGEGGGAGLQYAVERTAYPTHIELAEKTGTFEISDEERAYNIETYKMVWDEGQPVFISSNGMLLSMFSSSGGTALSLGYVEFNTVTYSYDELFSGLVSTSIMVYANGDAKQVIKSINVGGGGNIDPELLEGFIPLSRDFSDDFNNDFSR